MSAMGAAARLAAVVALALAAGRAEASGAPAEQRGGQGLEQLWTDEGATLRALTGTARGEEKADVLVRLGEWEREAATRLRRAAEEGKGAADEAAITAHLDAAEQAYGEAVGLAGKERLPQALFALGDLRRFRGNPKGAAEPLARLVDEHPEHPLAVDAATALGDDLFEGAKLADAMRRYQFAADRGRTNGAKAYARYKLAWCHLNLDEFAEARALFTEVVALATANGKSISLADEARRDMVIALARDAQTSADDARRTIEGMVQGDRARRYLEGYARLIAGSGRDTEAAQLFAYLEPGSTGSDAARLFTHEMEIFIRRRDLPQLTAAARKLSDTLEMGANVAKEIREQAERSLRVAAVTLHGEGRTNSNQPALEAALALYESYFRAFDGEPWAYELHHHAGELLQQQLKRPADAERHFSAAVQRDLVRLAEGQPAGKWLLPSAQGAVFAAQEALPPAQLPARTAPAQDEDVDRPPPQPTALAEGEKVLVGACDRYLKALPQGPDAVQVAYQRALVFYRHNHLDEAGPALRAIALNFPESEPASYAAELSLDALRLLGKYDELAQLAGEYRNKPALLSKLGDELSELREAALLAAAAREAAHGNLSLAAQRYVSFAETFPKSTHVDRALYNGAAALTQTGRLAEAVRLRGKLLQQFPKSALHARARERQLADLLLLGRFQDGARMAAAIADEAKGSEAATRMHDAIVLAEAAGDLREADRWREKYLKDHPRGADAMTHALALAGRTKGCESGAKAYQKALSVAPDLGWRAVALSRLAKLEQSCRHEDQARRYAGEAAAINAKLPKGRADALDASADAALLLVQPLLEKYRGLPLKDPYEKTLPKKLAALKQVDDKLASVVARGRAGAAVCALVGSGIAYGDLAKGLQAAKAPRSFTEEQKAIFEEELAEKAQPLFDRSKTALMEAITRAREAGVAPGCLADARKMLASLWPERFGTRQDAVVALGGGLETASLDAAKILAQAPDAPAAWLMAARAELAANHPQAAIVLTERIQKEDWLSPQALEVKARALEVLDQHDAALAVWLALAKEHPERPLARRVLADRAIVNRDLEAAKEHLLALPGGDKDFAVALNLGVVLRELGDVAGAEKTTRNAVQLDPKRPEALLNLGLLLCNEGNKPAEGVEQLERFLKEGGNPPDGRGFQAAMDACRALAKGGS